MNRFLLITTLILVFFAVQAIAVEYVKNTELIQESFKSSNYAHAMKLYGEMKDLVHKLPIGEQVSLFNNLGIIASRAYHEHEAISFYKAGLNLVKNTDNSEQLQVFVENIAAVYVRLGDTKNALSYLKMSELLIQQQQRPLSISLLNNIGTNEFYLDNFENALSYHKKAFERLKSVYNDHIPEEYRGVVYNLVWDYVALNDYSEAQRLLQQLVRNISEIDLDLTARLLYVEALAGSSQEAEAQLLAILNGKQALSKNVETFTCLALSEIARQRQQWAQQADFLIKAFNSSFAEFYVNDLSSELPPKYKSFQRKCLLIADALCRAGKSNDAWVWIQKANFRAENTMFIHGSGTRALQSVLQLERQLILNYGNEINGKSFLGDEPTKALDCVTLERKYEEAKADLRKTNQTLWENLFSERVNVHPDDLDQIRHILPDDVILLEIVILNEQVAIFVCSKKSPVLLKTISVKNAERRVKGLVMQYRQVMSSPGSLTTAQSICKTIYDLIFAPVVDDIAQLNPKTILFAPAGILRYVSLATLYDGQRYLVEKYCVANLCGYDLIRIGSNEQIPGDCIKFIAFSNPDGTLPASEKECTEIASNFSVSYVFSQHNATLKQFLSLAGDTSFVHLATHGVLNAECPEDSYLVFSDDKLYYKDMIVGIPKMNNLGMLTLSACNTANMNPIVLDNNALEIYGMAYQFVRKTHSGATLATLWSVSDEHTQRLMTSMYRQLIQNAQSARQWHRAQCLTQAQRQLLKMPGAEHPFFWGAFIMIGNYQ